MKISLNGFGQKIHSLSILYIEFAMEILSSCYIEHPKIHYAFGCGHLNGNLWSGNLLLYSNDQIPLKDQNTNTISQTAHATLGTSNFGCVNAMVWNKSMAESIICGNLNGELMRVSISKILAKEPSEYCMSLLYQHNGSIEAIDTFTNSSNLIIGNDIGQVMIYDLTSSTATTQWCHSRRIISVASGKANDQIFGSTSYDGSSLLWDLRIKKHSIQIGYQHNIDDSTATSISFHHQDPNLVALGHLNGMLRLFDLRKPNHPIHSLNVAKNGINIKFSPNKTNQLAIGTNDASVKVVDVETFKIVYELNCHQDIVSSVTWSRKEDEFVSASWDGTVRKHKIES